MVILLETNATDKQIEDVIKHLEDFGFQTHKSVGAQRTIVGAIGVQPDFDIRKVKILDGVYDVYRITVPYKLASRSFHEENSIIKVKDIEISGNDICLMAGPCSIENEEQMYILGQIVKESGTKILRGGAYKPRSSPYSFQGLGLEGLKLIRKVADEFDLIVITEVMQINQIEEVYKYSDLIQNGARNMQNFALLKELGTIDKPIMLKRGLASTIEE